MEVNVLCMTYRISKEDNRSTQLLPQLKMRRKAFRSTSKAPESVFLSEQPKGNTSTAEQSVPRIQF